MSNRGGLEARVALVTGAGGEIGRAISLRLASEGACVIVNDIHGQNGKETAEMVNSRTGNACFICADISDEVQVKRLVQEAVDKFGGLDILVNNAGVDLDAPLGDMPLKDWRRLQDVDLGGAYLTSKHAIPYLKVSNSGSIVNISSIHANMTQAGRTAYASAKSGLVGLTRAMALDLGPEGIRVNAILPGYIRTKIWQVWLSKVEDPSGLINRISEQHPLKRVGTPEDVASAVAFLVSEDASFITGTTLVVDGGLSSMFAPLPI